MIPFGMYRKEASADLEVIDGITAGGGRLAVTGVQDGSNTTFTLSAAPSGGLDGLIFARNGLVLSPLTDFSLVGNVVTLNVAPLSDDTLLAIAIGGQ